MKIVITGGAGYIGTMTVSLLLQHGFEVTVFDKCLFGATPLLAFSGNPKFRLVRGDVRSRSSLQLAMENAQAVIHLAAIVGEPACAVDPEASKEINLRGTEITLSVAKECGVERFIFASTCSNYGISEVNTLTDERSPLRPLSDYAKAKVMSEELVLANDRSLTGIVLRFGTICGLSPQMRFDLLISDMARAAAFNKPIQIFAPDAWRPFLHVKDAARAIMLCLEAPIDNVKSKVFNVVGENYQKIGLAALVHKHFPSTNIEIVNKALDARDYRVSGEKFERELKFKPAYTIEQAFLETTNALSMGVFLDPFWHGYSVRLDKKEKMKLDMDER